MLYKAFPQELEMCVPYTRLRYQLVPCPAFQLCIAISLSPRSMPCAAAVPAGTLFFSAAADISAYRNLTCG